MKMNTERADSSWMRITGLVAFVGILGLAAVGCVGNDQAGDSDTALPQPPIVSISASPTVVPAQGSSTLTWSSMNATSCAASGAWSGSQAIAGAASTGPLSQDSTFTLTCTGAGRSASASVTVTIDPCNGCWDYPAPPVVTLTASPTSVAYGASSTLTWSSTDATSCTASGAWSGAQATAGSISTGALTASSTYTITCSGAGGTATQSVTVLVGSPPAPIVAISADPAVVDAGASSTLTWSSPDATAGTASGAWSGTQATAGSASTGVLNCDSTFTLTCTGPEGSTSASVTVTVTGNDAGIGCWDY
jgi:hypothetical protein